MKDIIEYHIAGFQLTIYTRSYIVEATPENEASCGQNDDRELPHWVFHSRHAIWLSREFAPISLRAIQGERIRRNILRRLQLTMEPGKGRPAYVMRKVREMLPH